MQKHAHIVTRVNAASIKKEQINGEPHYRIPSATLPDNVVMNGGLYGAEEIAASYKGLEGTPAPLGHPKIGNQFVPASSPHAINKHWIGAWNENVRREGGRVLLDKVVNIRVANQTEPGKQLIQAIEAQTPIHTSTGLQLEMKVANGESNGKPYSWVATNMQFDHDAILLGEPGAATPEEGVGMFVNAENEESEVIVCNIDHDSLDWMVEDMARNAVLEQHESEKNGLMDKIRQAIKSVLGSTQESSESSLATNSANAPEGDMNEEQMKALLTNALAPIQEQISTLATNQAADSKAMGEQGEAIKELKTNADEQKQAANAEIDAKLKAAGFDDEDLKGMTANAKQKVLAKHQPSGFHINTSFGGQAAEDTNTLPE